MFGKPRQLETEAGLYDVGARALMQRAHSVHEMKRKLERRSDNKLLVQLVLARLNENGQIDDARYAKQFTRQRTETHKQGKFQIARDPRRSHSVHEIEQTPARRPFSFFVQRRRHDVFFFVFRSTLCFRGTWVCRSSHESLPALSLR